VVVVEHHSNALKGPKEWILSSLVPVFSDHVVYLSEQYVNQVLEKLPFLRFFSRRSVIPNGLLMSRFEIASDREAGVIGMSGRMDVGKDYETLIRAFASIDADVRLSLIGDGPDRVMLQNLCSDLNIEDRVTFHGLMMNNEVLKTMSSWDIFVLSTEGETMSVAIMEAQALALPVVASNVSGVTSAINDNHNGLLFEVGSTKSLREKLLTLLDDGELKHRLASAAATYARDHYSIDKTWAQYHKIIFS